MTKLDEKQAKKSPALAYFVYLVVLTLLFYDSSVILNKLGPPSETTPAVALPASPNGVQAAARPSVLATTFNGGTTAFSKLGDLSQVSGLVFEKTEFGKIAFSKDSKIDASNKNLDENVVIGNSFVSVNTPEIGPSFAAPATVTLYRIQKPRDKTVCYDPGFFTQSGNLPAQCKNCILEGACSNVKYGNDSVSFDASHFSTYYLESDSALFEVNSISEVPGLVQKYGPRIVVIAGKHESVEPSARLISTSVDGKPFYQYFSPNEILFVKIPEKETPVGVYGSYFDYFNEKLRSESGAGKAALELALQTLFSDQKLLSTLQALSSQQSNGLSLEVTDPAFLENYMTLKGIQNTAGAVALLKKIDAGYQLPPTDFGYNDQIVSAGAIPIQLHFTWGREPVGKIGASQDLLADYDLFTDGYVEEQRFREDATIIRTVFPRTYLIDEEPEDKSYVKAPSLGSSSKGFLIRLLSTGIPRRDNVNQVGAEYLQYVSSTDSEKFLPRRASKLFGFLKNLLQNIKNKPPQRIASIYGGETSEIIKETTAQIQPKNANEKLTSLSVSGMTCVDDKGSVIKTPPSAYFDYSVRTVEPAGCAAYEKSIEGPYYEIRLNRKKEIPFSSCKLQLDVKLTRLEPFEVLEQNVPLLVYSKGYIPDNVLVVTSLEEALSRLKTLGRVPKLVVTYGKHEPGEPSKQLFESFDKKEHVIADYFGDDTIFIAVPESETPRGYYSGYYDHVQSLIDSGKLPQALTKKIEAFENSVDQTIDEPDQKPAVFLTENEIKKLYGSADYSLPMSETEFTHALSDLYMGCSQLPFHVSVHYGSQTSKIYAMNQVLSEQADLFSAIKADTGITAVQDPELGEILLSTTAIKKKLAGQPLSAYPDAATGLSEKQFYQSLIHPLLEKSLLADYGSRATTQDLTTEKYFIMELSRKSTRNCNPMEGITTNCLQPLTGKPAQGARLRTQLLFGGSRFDNLFAIGDDYLAEMSLDEARQLFDTQIPLMISTLQDTYRFSNK